MDSAQFLQQIINGLSIGATYALIALGYTMVYGVLRLINFAHGEIYMVGAVSGWYLADLMLQSRAPQWLSVVVVFLGAMAICAMLGAVIEFFAYRPLRDRPRLVVLITAIGMSLLLQNLAQLESIFGPNPRRFPELVRAVNVVSLDIGGGVTIDNYTLLSLGLAVFLMGGLTWMILGTRTGLAMRAVSFRFETARLMGVNTGRVISATFMIGSALAAVAGVLDGMRYDVRWQMGVLAGMKAFVAAVLGGIGNIPGAVLGAMLLGLLEAILKGGVLREYGGLADAAAFAVLIVILLVRPNGILGRASVEKV